MIKKFLFSLVAIALLSLAGCQDGTQSDATLPTTGTSAPAEAQKVTVTPALTPTTIVKESVTPTQAIQQEETVSTTPKATPPTPTAPADITPTSVPTPTVPAKVTPTPKPDAVLVTVVPKGEITVQVEGETLVVTFDEEGRLDSVQESGAKDRTGLRSYVYWGGSEHDYYINYFYVESKCDMAVRRGFSSDGTPVWERDTGRYGSFGYFEILSRNADGTVTLEYKVVPKDQVEEKYYYMNGNLQSWDKRWYKPLEEGELESSDKVPLVREYMTYKEDGSRDRFIREENERKVAENIYGEDIWIAYEYYIDRETWIKSYAMYWGEGTSMPLGKEQYAEDGTVTESVNWSYNDDGSYVQKWLDVNLYNDEIPYICKENYCMADGTVIYWIATDWDENANVTARTTYIGEGTSKPQVASTYANQGVIQSRKLYCYGENNELLRYNAIFYDQNGYVTSTDTVVYKPKEECSVPEVPENDGAGREGRIEMAAAELETSISATKIFLDRFYSEVASVSQFVTPDGYGVASHGSDVIVIHLYSKNLILYDTVTLLKDYDNLGAVTCDDEGNFYAVYGIDNLSRDLSRTVMSIVKYSPDGQRLCSADFTAEETVYSEVHCKEDMETKYVFTAGNCSVAISDGVLACHHARQMINGHQSNMVHYVDISTMEKLEIVPSYTSHSMDQQIIATKDGGFLLADHGDGAPERAFMINKVESKDSDWDTNGVAAFHFREGANRPNGYNETYAQLGGIAELPNAYVLVGASERTLSLDTSQTGGIFCGYSESRDLFIQYLKKDFKNYVKEESWDSSGYVILKEGFAVTGETRTAEGTKPTNAETALYLPANTEDYGVIWLTNYKDDEMAYNPKAVTTETGEVIILWQKVLFDTREVLDTYYMILDRYGAVLREPTSLGVVPLSTNEPAVYLDGSVYWTVAANGTQVTSYRFVIPEVEDYSPEEDIRWRLFDADYYLEQHPELKETVGTDRKTLYVYWMNTGITLGHAASPVFVPAEHMLLHRELTTAMKCDYFALAEHFFNEGIYEGERGSLEFDYAVYREANPDLDKLFGNDAAAYYEHYVAQGRAEGRTACKEGDTLPSTNEFTLVTEGVQKFVTDDLLLVEIEFDRYGDMEEMRLYDTRGKLVDELEYCDMDYVAFRYVDRVDGVFSGERVVNWQFADDGTLLYKEVDASKKELLFAELVSENEDGTITIRLEKLEKGNAYTENYRDGILYSLQERKYNDAGELIQQISYDVAPDGTRTVTWDTYYENGNMVDDNIYADGVISRHSEYKYDEAGHLSQMEDYYYDLDGNLNYYDIFTYAYDPKAYQCNYSLLLTHKQYAADGSLKEEICCEYHEDGIQKEMEKKTYSNGTVTRHYLWRYNTMGYEIYYLYYRNGKFNTHMECEYYANGQLKWEAYYKDETTDNMKSITKYDENGNVITD